MTSTLNVLLYTTEKQVVKRFLAGYHESSHLIFYFLTIPKSAPLKSIKCKGKREQHSKHTLEQQDPNFLVLKECDSLMSHLSPQQRARLSVRSPAGPRGARPRRRTAGPRRPPARQPALRVMVACDPSPFSLGCTGKLARASGTRPRGRLCTRLTSLQSSPIRAVSVRSDPGPQVLPGPA